LEKDFYLGALGSLDHVSTLHCDFVLFVVKGLLPLNMVESIWMMQSSLWKEPQVVFASFRTFIENILPSMMKCTLQEFFFPFVNATTSIIATSNLWINKGAFNTFALVINFLTLDWKPKLVTIGLFEAKGSFRVNLVGQLQVLFKKYKFTNKIICYTKYESTNLSTITNALKQIIICEKLAMYAPFEGVCFGHALSKACQYAISDEKVNSNLQLVSIKTA